MFSPHRIRVLHIAALSLIMLFAAPTASQASALYTLTDFGPSKGDINYAFNASGQVVITTNSSLGRLQDGAYYIQLVPNSGPADNSKRSSG